MTNKDIVFRVVLAVGTITVENLLLKLWKRIREEKAMQLSIFDLNGSSYVLYHNRATGQPLAV